jgi:hypothetical protein
MGLRACSFDEARGVIKLDCKDCSDHRSTAEFELTK